MAHTSHNKVKYNQFHQSLFTEKLWETCRAVLEQFKPLIIGGMDSYTQKIIFLTRKGIWLHRAMIACNWSNEGTIYLLGVLQSISILEPWRTQPIEATHMKTCVMLQMHALTGGNDVNFK
jgi:hypothetical protein